MPSPRRLHAKAKSPRRLRRRLVKIKPRDTKALSQGFLIHPKSILSFLKRRKKRNSKERLKITSWIAKRRLTLCWWLVALGFLLVAFPAVYKQGIYLKQAPLSKTTTQVTLEGGGIQSDEPIRIDPALLSQIEPSQPPQQVVVPSRNIDLPIVEARVVNGYWELSETTASHGIGSANPGTNGNIVVFAHARQGLFLPLRDIKKDEVIYLLTKDRWFRYRVVETKLVDPWQTEVIAPTSDETVTLYTCSGFMDSKRLIVTGKPLSP